MSYHPEAPTVWERNADRREEYMDALAANAEPEEWQPLVLETDEDLAATEASALVNADAVESEHAVQELAWTARHYLAELTKMRELAQRLASMHQRRCKDLGHLANTEQRELLDACRKAFPFLIASGEVKRG